MKVKITPTRTRCTRSSFVLTTPCKTTRTYTKEKWVKMYPEKTGV